MAEVRSTFPGIPLSGAYLHYVGLRGCSLGMETFGASAPLGELRKRFGFTVEHVVSEAKKQTELNPRL
jgi:transketolase